MTNPNIYIDEKRLLEEMRVNQRENEQPLALTRTSQHEPALRTFRLLLASLGARFILFGTRMQQFAQPGDTRCG